MTIITSRIINNDAAVITVDGVVIGTRDVVRKTSFQNAGPLQIIGLNPVKLELSKAKSHTRSSESLSQSSSRPSYRSRSLSKVFVGVRIRMSIKH